MTTTSSLTSTHTEMEHLEADTHKYNVYTHSSAFILLDFHFDTYLKINLIAPTQGDLIHSSTKTIYCNIKHNIELEVLYTQYRHSK